MTGVLRLISWPLAGPKDPYPRLSDFNIEVYGKVRARPPLPWPGLMGIHASSFPFEI